MMKTKNYFLVFVLMLHSLLSFSQWQSFDTTGLNKALVNDMIVLNDTLYLLSSKGLYYSPSGMGGDLQKFGTLLDNLNVSSLINAHDGAKWAVAGGYIYKYSTLNSEWDTLITTGLTGADLGTSTGKVDEIFEHKDGMNYYLFASGWDKKGIYRSVDNGTTWTLYDSVNLTGLEDTTGSSIEGLTNHSSSRLIARKFISLSNGKIVNAYKNAIQISEDNGLTWYWRIGDYPISLSASNIGSIYTRNYQGTDYFFISTDVNSAGYYLMGASSIDSTLALDWVQKGTGITREANGTTVSSYSHSDSLIFATGFNDFHVSYNNGDNFISIKDNFNNTVLLNELRGISCTGEYFYARMTTGAVFKYSVTDVPVIDSLTLRDTTINSITADFRSSRYGSAYYVVLPADSAAPSKQQILKGMDAKGNMASISGTIAFSDGVLTNKVISGLNAATQYKMYLVARSKVLTTSSVQVLSFETKPAYNVTFVVYNATDSLQNAKVTFTSTLLTDAFGMATFTYVVPNPSIAYKVVLNGYDTVNGTVSVVNADVVENVLMTPTQVVPIAEEAGVSLFPIPVNDFLNVEINSMELPALITITDLLGKQLIQQEIKEKVATFFVGDLVAGYYIVTITSNNKEISMKIIK